MKVRYGWVSNSSSCGFVINKFSNDLEGLNACKEIMKKIIRKAHEFNVCELNKMIHKNDKTKKEKICVEDFSDNYYDAVTKQYKNFDNFFDVGSQFSTDGEFTTYKKNYAYAATILKQKRCKLNKNSIIVFTKFEDNEDDVLMSLTAKEFNNEYFRLS